MMNTSVSTSNRISGEKRRRLLALAGASLTVLTAMPTIAAPGPILLQEQLNQTYGPELISIPFHAGNQECVVDGVQLDGPRGAVAVQLSDPEFWPSDNKFVKSARLWFVADELKPLTTATYTPKVKTAKTTAVSTDLSIKPGPDSVEITTANVGVRLPLGDASFPAPVPAQDVPGPLLAMRLGNGAWAGGSSITGAVKVAHWSSQLTGNGPVFARVATVYTLADSNTLTVTATVVAGDSVVRWTMSAPLDSPVAVVAWRLPPVPNVKQALLPKGFGEWAKDRQAAVNPGGAPFCWLSPDSSIVNIFPEHPPVIQLVAESGQELRLASMNPSVWVEPVPLTYGGVKIWELAGVAKTWDAWKRQCLPVSYAADGVVTIAAPVTKGNREWLAGAGAPRVGLELNHIKDLVLDWPAAGKPHPGLFVGLPEIKDVWARAAADPELMKALASGGGETSILIPLLMKPAEQRKPEEIERAVKSLRDPLALLGRFDVMRHAIGKATQYDLLIDSGLLTPADQTLFRAQMAYLGYLMADPQCWSMERGYCSGNPNMSCSYALSLGVIGCALSDHPAAKQWTDYATQWMDKWLTDEVGPNGEWISEGGHYSYVSLAPMLSYAIAAKRAGFHDYSNDPRLKKLILFFAKYNTPHDVRRKGRRVNGIYGRGTVPGIYDVDACFGTAAAFYQQSDPAFSRAMQWLAIENGFPYNMADARLGGCEPYFMGRRLPAEAPVWTSELFSDLGVLSRAAFNTTNESYLNFLGCVRSERNLDIWTPGVGGISQWYGRGKPVSSCFTFGHGYNDRHELLRDGVRLARNWGAPGDSKGPFGHYTQTHFEAFAAFPTVDYARSTFVNTRVDDRDWFPAPAPPAYPQVTPASGTNLTWTRQLLFLKDIEPAGPAWLAVRDTVVAEKEAKTQPTAWQFWTLSEKLGTPEQVQNADTFLADKLGATNAPARELPMGDRYTALGQFGMDLEYFIVSPSTTPRHTLRCGGPAAVRSEFEYQDLLHLQLPGAGAYYVALFPRPRTEVAPTFSSLADGKIIKVIGAFGMDLCFLNDTEATAAAAGATFRGTSAAVQKRGAGLLLTLGASGAVSFEGYRIAAEFAVGMRTAPDKIVITLPADYAGGGIEVKAPGRWKVSVETPAELTTAKGMRLKARPGAATIILVKK